MRTPPGLARRIRWSGLLLLVSVIVAGPKFSNGQNDTDKFLNHGVFDYGGGLDFRLFRFIGLRAEVRDFLSGNPGLNIALNSSTQHNVVASGGVVLRF